MNIIIDTTIWSEIFRRKTPDPEITKTLYDIMDPEGPDNAVIIGNVRQEFLSGIHDPKRFQKLRHRLSAFTDTPTTTEDHELAAEYLNICRRNGIQGSHVDFLLCAISHRLRAPIFTTDQDFHLYAKHLPITLYHPA